MDGRAEINDRDNRSSVSNYYHPVHTQRSSIRRYDPMYQSNTSNEEQKRKKQESPSLWSSICNYFTGTKDKKSASSTTMHSSAQGGFVNTSINVSEPNQEHDYLNIAYAKAVRELEQVKRDNMALQSLVTSFSVHRGIENVRYMDYTNEHPFGNEYCATFCDNCPYEIPLQIKESRDSSHRFEIEKYLIQICVSTPANAITQQNQTAYASGIIIYSNNKGCYFLSSAHTFARNCYCSDKKFDFHNYGWILLEKRYYEISWVCVHPQWHLKEGKVTWEDHSTMEDSYDLCVGYVKWSRNFPCSLVSAPFEVSMAYVEDKYFPKSVSFIAKDTVSMRSIFSSSKSVKLLKSETVEIDGIKVDDGNSGGVVYTSDRKSQCGTILCIYGIMASSPNNNFVNDYGTACRLTKNKIRWIQNQMKYTRIFYAERDDKNGYQTSIVSFVLCSFE
eukprot:419599_1